MIFPLVSNFVCCVCFRNLHYQAVNKIGNPFSDYCILCLASVFSRNVCTQTVNKIGIFFWLLHFGSCVGRSACSRNLRTQTVYKIKNLFVGYCIVCLVSVALCVPGIFIHRLLIR